MSIVRKSGNNRIIWVRSGSLSILSISRIALCFKWMILPQRLRFKIVIRWRATPKNIKIILWRVRRLRISLKSVLSMRRIPWMNFLRIDFCLFLLILIWYKCIMNITSSASINPVNFHGLKGNSAAFFLAAHEVISSEAEIPFAYNSCIDFDLERSIVLESDFFIAKLENAVIKITWVCLWSLYFLKNSHVWKVDSQAGRIFADGLWNDCKISLFFSFEKDGKTKFIFLVGQIIPEIFGIVIILEWQSSADILAFEEFATFSIDKGSLFRGVLKDMRNCEAWVGWPSIFEDEVVDRAESLLSRGISKHFL